MSFRVENSFATQLNGLYETHVPGGFPAPELVVENRTLLDLLGFADYDSAKLESVFSGNQLLPGSQPLAQAYAGHQFGAFSPQLGDGRAILLGEVVTEGGERFDIQLKGAGRTKFSRGGDGRAALGPALREYLVSEAMYQLGVSTTRVLVVLRTGETITRDGPLPGAVLARVAKSHLRVGTLEYFSARGELGKLRRLVDYALWRHYPDRVGKGTPAAELLNAVAKSQARVIASWMHVGFVHGVMNTDNVALSGETLDYGPCAFIDGFDPEAVFSSIDHRGRYAYGNQPRIGRWNLARMAEALIPLLSWQREQAAEMARAELEVFQREFDEAWLDGFRRKLGLLDARAGDHALVQQLLDAMLAGGLDFTSTFRRLSARLESGSRFAENEPLGQFFQNWTARLAGEARGAVVERMNQVNPVYIPRNHQVEAALQAATEGDAVPFERLLGVLKRPFDDVTGQEEYRVAAPPEFGPYRTFCGT